MKAATIHLFALRAAGLFLLLAGRLWSAETNRLPDVAAISPCPAVIDAAALHGIPMAEMGVAGEPGTLNAGDSITALVTMEKRGQRTQWLLYMEALPEDKPSGSNASRGFTMYSSTGSKLKFTSTPAPVSLRTLGPYSVSPGKRKPPKAKDQKTRFSIDKSCLALGLDHAAEVVSRIRNSQVKGSFGFRHKPFSEREIAETRKRTAAMKLTAEEERALAGAFPALVSYFNLVQQTEGLSEILLELIDLPSMWSLARKGGVEPKFRFLNDVKKYDMPSGSPAYRLPVVLHLNDHPALHITLMVTRPHPPFLGCGGIVGLVAEKPRSKDTFLTLRVLSARHRPEGTNTAARKGPSQISGEAQ